MENKPSSVVVVETKSGHWYQNKKVLGVLVLLVAAIGGGVYAYVSRQSDEPNIIGPTYKQTEFDTAQNLVDSGKPDEAYKIIDEQIAKASDPKEKSDLMSQKASLLSDAGKKTDALKLSQQAFQTNPSFIAAKLTAVLAEEQGNKTVAIEYYKKTIELMNKQSPMYGTDKQNYEAKIAELQQ